jgi:signal transduction histidine kinase
MDPVRAPQRPELPALLLATEQDLLAAADLCQELAAVCREARHASRSPDAAEREPSVPPNGDDGRALGELDSDPGTFAPRLVAGLRRIASELGGQADVLAAAVGEAPPEPQTPQPSAGRLRAAEAERARLARDLHDGPAQYFANAVFETEYLQKLLERDPAAVREGLVRLRQALQQGVKEVRQCLFDLRLPSVESLGLVALLQGYLPEYERQYGVTVVATLPHDEPRVSGDQAIAVFRILQEALTNARKHSGAEQVRVRLRQQRDEVVMEVEDTGRGFSLEQAPAGHYGLVGMQERARLVGGRLEIHGRPGKGARVVVRLPASTVMAPAVQERLPEG